MRIERGEARWPHRLAQVGTAGDERIRETGAERKGLQAHLGAAVSLREVRHHRRSGSQREEGQLLQERPAPRCRESRARRFAPPSAQRPRVEQQQHEGQRHQHGLRRQAEPEERDDRQVPSSGPPPDVLTVSREGQQEEAPAQHVLALGDPRDRFHVKGVHREQERHHRAPPRRAGHPEQDQEQQERVDEVEQDVDEVVEPGVEPEQLHVDHVREPRDWVPVGDDEARARVLQPDPAHALEDVRVRRRTPGRRC